MPKEVIEHILEDEMGCPECNWQTKRLLSVEGITPICSNCFVGWLVDNKKKVV